MLPFVFCWKLLYIFLPVSCQALIQFFFDALSEYACQFLLSLFWLVVFPMLYNSTPMVNPFFLSAPRR